MTRKTKTNLKIASATMTCIFTLATAFTSTLAWFSMNREVSGSGMSVTVAVGSNLNIVSCYALKYDGNYGAIAIDTTAGESIMMSEYDSIFKDRNVNTPLFLRMEITGFNKSNDLKVVLPCSGTYKTDNKIDAYLSNVVSAKFMTGIKENGVVIADTFSWSGSSAHTDSVIRSYHGMVARASDVVGKPYVSSGTKVSSLTLTLEASVVFANSNIYLKNGEETVSIFVGLDYHVTGNINLVSDYIVSHGGTGYDLIFLSDINQVTLSNEDN